MQSGQTYEREAIISSLKLKAQVDPLSNATFVGEAKLCPNYSIRSLVDRWKQIHSLSPSTLQNQEGPTQLVANFKPIGTAIKYSKVVHPTLNEVQTIRNVGNIISTPPKQTQGHNLLSQVMSFFHDLIQFVKYYLIIVALLVALQLILVTICLISFLIFFMEYHSSLYLK
jgi:hypothetical protein